jgi:hypothetical protein
MTSTGATGTAGASIASATGCEGATTAGRIEKGKLSLDLFALAMGANEIGICILYGADEFKGVAAIRAAVFINRHSYPFLDKMTLIVPFYRDHPAWSI